MREAANMVTETPFDRLLLILCGTEKSGKSRTASTARKPVLFFDFDKRRQSLAGIKDVYAITYIDEQWPKMPTGYNDLLTDLTKIEQGAKIKDLISGATDERQPRTLVFDSLASLGKSASAYALYSNKDIRRSIKVGGTEIFMPGGWDAWNAETESVFQAVMRAMAMPHKPDIILIFHEAEEQSDRSTPEKKVFTGKVSLYPDRYKVFNKYFSEVWRVSRDTGGQIPKIQVVPDFRFLASSNLDFSKISPDKLNPATGPNIGDLIKLATGKE